jgi:hypothetical protein
MTDLTLPEGAQHAAALSQATAVEQSRAVAEVQAAVVVAQANPRNMDRAEAEMRTACGRRALAKRSFYSMPRAGGRVEGPTVHLARELARIYGNLDYGVRELRRDDAAGESEMQAWAWDQEKNVRSTRSFIQPHQRMVQKQRVDLVDLGDVYLNNQNTGARAVRECIFTVLPVWFTEEAQDAARATIERGDGTPIAVRVTEALQAFAQHGVTPERLEARIGRPRVQWTPQDIASLEVIFGTLQRRESRVEEEFPEAPVTLDTPTVAETPETVTEAAPSVTEEPATVTEPEVPMMTDATRKHLFALLNEFGLTDAAAQKAGMSKVLGRKVTSRASLTEAEAQILVADLKARKANTAEPADDGDPNFPPTE